MTRVAVLGVGAVGARVARQLLSSQGVHQVVLRDEQAARLETIARSLGEGARIDTLPYEAPVDADVVVLAGPVGTHIDVARRVVAQGLPVVSVSDGIDDDPPNGFIFDGVHPTEQGQSDLADAYDDALQGCSRPWKFW